MESAGDLDQSERLPVDAGVELQSSSSGSEERLLPRRSQCARRKPDRYDPQAYAFQQEAKLHKKVQRQNEFLKQCLKVILDT